MAVKALVFGSDKRINHAAWNFVIGYRGTVVVKIKFSQDRIVCRNDLGSQICFGIFQLPKVWHCPKQAGRGSAKDASNS